MSVENYGRNFEYGPNSNWLASRGGDWWDFNGRKRSVENYSSMYGVLHIDYSLPSSIWGAGCLTNGRIISSF